MEESKTFKKIIEETREITKEFEKREKRKWIPETMVTELAKQLGEVSKQIMMLEGNYLPRRDTDPRYAHSKEQLADELSDIFANILRIADHYQIDLEEAHLKELESGKKWFEGHKI